MTNSIAADPVAARIAVVDRAKAEAGLHDFGGDTWRKGLDVVVRSALNEASFNDLGEQMFFAGLVRALVNRLQVEDWYRRHPEIDEQDPQVEFLGVGFPRTGSTAFSHLVGEDNAYRNLRNWEQSTPCPPPGVSAEADEARIATALATVDLGREPAPLAPLA